MKWLIEEILLWGASDNYFKEAPGIGDDRDKVIQAYLADLNLYWEFNEATMSGENWQKKSH